MTDTTGGLRGLHL